MVDKVNGVGGPSDGDNGINPQRISLVQSLNRAGINPSDPLLNVLRSIEVINPQSVSGVLILYGHMVENVTSIVDALNRERSTPVGKEASQAIGVHLPYQIYIPPQLCEPYKISPDLSHLPKDRVSSQIKQAADRIYGPCESEVKARAIAITNWYFRNVVFDLMGYSEIARVERQIGETGKVRDYIDALNRELDKLDPRPDFNTERFGDPNKELDEATMAAISFAMDEELLIPNNLLVVKRGWGKGDDSLALIDPTKSFNAVTPYGRNIPVLYSIPIRGDFGNIMPSTNYVVLPTDYIQSCLDVHPTLRRNYQHLVSGAFDVSQLDFQADPMRLPLLLGANYAGIVGDDLDAIRIRDDLLEILSQSDYMKAAESVLGRRLNENIPGDLITEARLITKKDSPLYRKLEAISFDEEPKRKEEYALALSHTRAKLSAIRYSTSSLLNFSDATFTAILDLDPMQLVNEAPYLLTTRKECTRLIGPKLSPTLDFGDDGEIDKTRWHIWANHNLRGRSNTEHLELVRGFDHLLKTVSFQLEDEHFTNLVEKPAGWREYNAQWECNYKLFTG